MRKSIYLLTTTPSSHTHRFHPLPLATPASCSSHPLATPINSTHSPQLSSILLTCAKFKVWMTIVESGWNLWVWLVGVVVRRYLDFLILLIPIYSSCIYLFFFYSSIPTICSCFYILYPSSKAYKHEVRLYGSVNICLSYLVFCMLLMKARVY